MITRESDETSQKSGPIRINSLNNLRGAACLIVVIYHLLIVFWGNNETAAALAHIKEIEVINPPISPIFLYLLHGLKSIHLDPGSFGVALFFLLSGYLIPISIEKLQPMKFAVSRFFRIFPTYWTTLLILILAQWIYSALHQQTFYLNGLTFISNFFMFRDLAWHPLVENAAWTLEVEIKFYIICATILYSKGRVSLKRGAFFCVLLMPMFFYSPINPQSFYAHSPNFYKALFTAQSQLIFIPYLLIGTTVYYFDSKYISQNLSIIAVTSLILTFLICGQQSINPTLGSEATITSYLLAVPGFLFAHYKGMVHQSNLFGFIARISYPLYLTHGTLGYIILTIIYPITKSPDITFALGLLAVISISTAVHYFVEMPGIRFGKQMINT